jgi:hypothetical protein
MDQVGGDARVCSGAEELYARACVDVRRGTTVDICWSVAARASS